MESARDLKPSEPSGEAPAPETASHNHVHVQEAEVATGGLARRLTPAAVEAGPVVSRFTEMQAACSCAGGCPTCIIVTAGSFALPFVFRNRKNGTETDQQ